MKKHSLSKALESLEKYPLVLYTGRECAILEGFGPGICAMLDNQLAIHRRENPSCLIGSQYTDVKEKSILQEIKSILGKKRNETKVSTDALKLPKNLDDTLEALYRKYDNIDDEFDRLVSGKTGVEATENIATNDHMPPRVLIPAGSFKVVLLVDTQETAG